MRIVMLVSLLVSMLISPVWADRIAELNTEGQKIQVEIQRTQQYLQSLQIRLIEISGAVKEITPKETKEVVSKGP